MKNYNLRSITIGAVIASLAMVGCNQDPEEPLVIADPIVLACNYFNENRTLVNYPDRPVDYLIECNMAVTADIIVMPGTVIEFTTDAGIKVAETGSFKAEGTAAQPIVFQGTEKIAGSWRGVFIDSNDPKNRFEYCTVMHGGGIAHNSNGDRGSFVIWSNSRITIENSSITNGDADGINAVYGGSDITLANNVISGHSRAPLRIVEQYLDVPNASDTYQGNAENYIVVLQSGGNIEEDLTWKKVDVPYKVTESGQVGIKSDVIIEPGVQIFFDAECSIIIRDGASLYAVGTAADRIVFRGLNPVAGAWGGIYFSHTTNTLNRISYAEIAHAGNPDFDGAVYMWAGPVVTVSNVNFSDLGSCAMYGGATSGVINLTQFDNTFVNVPQEVCAD